MEERNKQIDLRVSESQAANFLIWAVEKNKKETVEELISQGVSVTAKSNAAICKAAEKGYEEIFEILLNAGADARARNNYPLEVAATNGFDEIIESIALHDPDALNVNNYAINYAINDGHIDTVEKLLALGVKVYNDADDIIYQAKLEGYDEIAKILEAKRA